VSISSVTQPVDPDYEIVRVDRDHGTLALRVVGKRPPGAVSIPPRLEDAYILLTQATAS
jgi:hypothetical protein